MLVTNWLFNKKQFLSESIFLYSNFQKPTEPHEKSGNFEDQPSDLPAFLLHKQISKSQIKAQYRD